MSPGINYDFSLFSAKGYLSEYYGTIEPDGVDGFLLRFLHDSYMKIPQGSSIVEIGGGPTVWQLISSRKKASRIVFAEFGDANRKEVSGWVKSEAGSFDWDHYFSLVLSLEGVEPSAEQVDKAKALLRSKVGKVVACDVFGPEPLCLSLGEFDVASVHFCPESATDSEDKFLLALRNIHSCIRPGGFLLMSLLRNASHYSIGDVRFPSFPVNESYMHRALASVGFSDVNVESFSFDSGDGYDGNMAVFARKIF